MSVTAPQYQSIGTLVYALRFTHGVDCFGLTENTDSSSGVDVYTLSVPNNDGDLVAQEGDWVLLDTITAAYHVCPDSLFRSMFTQEGVIPA